MSDYPSDLSRLTGPELVRAFVEAMGRPLPTNTEKAQFFDFKSRVFATIAERRDDPEASRAAACARAESDLLWAQIAADEALNGGDR